VQQLPRAAPQVAPAAALDRRRGNHRHRANRWCAAPEKRAQHVGCGCRRVAVQSRATKYALQASWAIAGREFAKFGRQHGRLVSALVRPLLWLAVFAAGFRNVFGVAIAEPYDTYIPTMSR
jgi:hypothetical protein